MKNKTIISAVLAMTLATGGLAFGQGYGDWDRHDRGRNDHADRQHDRRDNDARQSNRRDGRAHRDQRREGRGVGPNHAYYRGDRLPVEYRNRYYVVNDWHGHHLSAPPRGYHWVQSGGDYILVAIATGIILQLMLSN